MGPYPASDVKSLYLRVHPVASAETLNCLMITRLDFKHVTLACVMVVLKATKLQIVTTMLASV